MQIMIWQAKSQKQTLITFYLRALKDHACIHLTTVWFVSFNTFFYLGHDKSKVAKNKNKQQQQQQQQNPELPT